MSAPQFGIINYRPETEVLPVLGADFSKVGIVAVSADASNVALPLGVAVRFASTDAALIAGMGTGLLADAVNGINDQIGVLGRSVDLIIVRIATGNNEGEMLQNAVDALDVLRASPEVLNATPRIIICPGLTSQVGSVGGTIEVTSAEVAGGNTGQGALTLAEPPSLTGAKNGTYTIRITGGTKSASFAAKEGGNTGDGTLGTLTADANAPVGDYRVICAVADTDGGIFTVLKPDGTLDAPGVAVVGAAYNSTSGINFTISDGAADFIVGDEFVVTVEHAVPAGGGTFSVTDPDGIALASGTVGTPYATHLSFTIADGTPDFAIGDGFDVEVAITDPTLTANPVVAALPSVLEGLLAVAFVDAPDTSLLAAENWRETIQSDRIIPIGVSVKVIENSIIVNRPASPRIAGLCVRVDNANRGAPFNPIANRPIYGIVGTNRAIPFSLTDGSVEGQLMLAADIGVIVRGELGVDDAAADGGFVYIGTESCAEGDLWSQFHQVRGSDYLTVKMMRLTRQFLGRAINADMAEAWLNSIKFMLRDHKALDDILGYKVDFVKDLNSPEQVRLGRLTVTPRIEPAPVFRVATHEIKRYRPAVDALVDEIISRLDASTVA